MVSGTMSYQCRPCSPSTGICSSPPEATNQSELHNTHFDFHTVVVTGGVRVVRAYEKPQLLFRKSAEGRTNPCREHKTG